MSSEPAGAAGERPFQVTHRLVLSVAVPMTLAYLTTPLLGIVDTAVVGQFADPFMLGGLAVGAIILDVAYAGFYFLRAGTTGLVAQAFGAGDTEEERAVLWRSVAISLAFGLAMVLLAPLIIMIGGWFMAAGPEVTAAMALYVGIRIVAAPITLTNYALLGYVLGRGQGFTGFGLQLVLNGSNIILSLWLGLHLGWGIEGVAWATVIAECLGALAGLAVILGRNRGMARLSLARLLDTPALMRMFAVNGDIMIRSIILVLAFALFTRSAAQLGELSLAANAILMNFFMVAGYLLDGFATAAEQLAGRSIGARYRPAFIRTIRLTGLWGLTIAVLLAMVGLLFGENLVAVMTTAPDIRIAAAVYLPWAALTALTGIAAFQMDGVYIGATWSRDMRNMMLLSFLAFLVALPLFSGWWGNHGNWIALHLFLLMRGITLYAMLPGNLKAAFMRPAASPAAADRQ